MGQFIRRVVNDEIVPQVNLPLEKVKAFASSEMINFMTDAKSHFFFLEKSLPGFIVNGVVSLDIASIIAHSSAFTSSEKFICETSEKNIYFKGFAAFFIDFVKHFFGFLRFFS